MTGSPSHHWTPLKSSGRSRSGLNALALVNEIRVRPACSRSPIFFPRRPSPMIREAVRVARTYGLDVHGTIWLLSGACRDGKLPEPAVGNMLDALRATGLRLPCTGAEFPSYCAPARILVGTSLLRFRSVTKRRLGRRGVLPPSNKCPSPVDLSGIASDAACATPPRFSMARTGAVGCTVSCLTASQELAAGRPRGRPRRCSPDR